MRVDPVASALAMLGIVYCLIGAGFYITRDAIRKRRNRKP